MVTTSTQTATEVHTASANVTGYGGCSGYSVTGVSGYYYYPVLTWTGGGCSQFPAQFLQITYGLITGVTGAGIGTGNGTPNGLNCTSVPSAVVHGSSQGIGNANYITGVTPILGPGVVTVGNPTGSFTEDTQMYNMGVDCGANGTPSSPGVSDFMTGLSIYGTQESSYFFGIKSTDCGIAALDVGGFSNQTQNLGPIVGFEAIEPAGANFCPTPGTTYQGTPFTTSNAVTSISSTTTGKTTVNLTSNVSQITPRAIDHRIRNCEWLPWRKSIHDGCQLFWCVPISGLGVVLRSHFPDVRQLQHVYLPD